jgi:uncharacterized membrane protein
MATNKFVSLQRAFDWVPADVIIVLALLLLCDLAVLTAASTPVKMIAGIPVVLILPGFAIVLALFPRGGKPTDRHGDRSLSGYGTDTLTGNEAEPPDTEHGRAITFNERLALSLGASVVVLPLIVLGLSAGGETLDVPTLLSVLTLLVCAGFVVGVVRRRQLPEQQRFEVPFKRWIAGLRAALFGAPKLDTALNIALIFAVLVASTGMIYVTTTPMSSASYTEFSLLHRNGSGELIAGEYPSELTVGNDTRMVVAVTNHETNRTNYTVVGELQRVTSNESGTIQARQEVTRKTVTLNVGEHWRHEHAVTPRLNGTDIRLTYYLYRGDSPADPSIESAYGHTYVWFDVTGNDSAATGG